MADKIESPHLQDGDPLAAAIVTAAKQASAEFTRWTADNPFYPSRDDLTGLVLLKLISVPQVRNIWSNPDPQTGGPVGLLRFARTVARRTAIDEKRRNEARAPEILAARLDEPIYDENGERTGDTLADTISDEDGTYQAFQFDDLREQLTEQEFTVLRGCVVNGTTQQELAQEMGTSDSSVSRTYTRAKERAQKWIDWLKQRTDKQARANIYPTFTRRPCLRPNGIAQETLAHWNGLTVVPFHDEAREWRPPITNKPRVRAERECFNDACTQGGAVGPDNLVLPSSQSTSGQCGDFRNAEKQFGDFRTLHGVTWVQQYEQPVRFLPAITGEVNQFCIDCEKENKRAEQRVPTRETATFFKRETRSRSSHESTRNKGSNMDYKEVAALVKEFDIPRATLARLADIHAPTLSSFLNGTVDLPQDKVERIVAWTADVAKMIQVMGTLGIKPDLTDIDNVRHLVQKINDAEKQLMLPLDDVLRDLPQDLPPLGSAAVLPNDRHCYSPG